MTWLARSHKRWALADGLTARFGPPPDAAALAAVWRALEPRADGSVFQSWLWLGCRYPARFDRAAVLTVEQDGAVLAIGLLNRRRAWPVPSRWFLGETGTPAQDSVFIEHNGPLVARDRPEARDAWFAALLGTCRGIGRMVQLSGVADADVAAARRHGVVGGTNTRIAPRRDLARLRHANTDCLDQMSANTRQQINRAQRRYEAAGKLTITRAATIPEAAEFLAALADLHQARWRVRGKPGAFAQPAFRRFHAALIDRGVAPGQIDLLRIAAGPQIIGYLYNFVWHGTVSAYQSGFAYEQAHPHDKPGLVCHVAAIRYYQARGLECYDFLAGNDRYKTSLADSAVALHWLRAAPRSSLAGALLGYL